MRGGGRGEKGVGSDGSTGPVSSEVMEMCWPKTEATVAQHREHITRHRIVHCKRINPMRISP